MTTAGGKPIVNAGIWSVSVHERTGTGMTSRAVTRAASAGESAVARTATDPTAVFIGRLGFVARGAVYVIVGWLAVLAAFGGAASTDTQGALEAIGQLPLGAVLVGTVAAGLFAYAACSFVRAVFDPER